MDRGKNPIKWASKRFFLSNNTPSHVDVQAVGSAPTKPKHEVVWQLMMFTKAV
jgi:hypothetical protein